MFYQECSFYNCVRDKHCVEMNLEDFVGYIRSGRWKSQTEEYQRLMAEGEKVEAKEVKNKMPGLVVAGKCEGSHALANLKSWSGYAMLDVDEGGDRVDSWMERLEQVSWVKAGWRSISGKA